jgi:hypothetical protein
MSAFDPKLSSSGLLPCKLPLHPISRPLLTQRGHGRAVRRRLPGCRLAFQRLLARADGVMG